MINCKEKASEFRISGSCKEKNKLTCLLLQDNQNILEVLHTDAKGLVRMWQDSRDVQSNLPEKKIKYMIYGYPYKCQTPFQNVAFSPV